MNGIGWIAAAAGLAALIYSASEAEAGQVPNAKADGGSGGPSIQEIGQGIGVATAGAGVVGTVLDALGIGSGAPAAGGAAAATGVGAEAAEIGIVGVEGGGDAAAGATAGLGSTIAAGAIAVGWLAAFSAGISQEGFIEAQQRNQMERDAAALGLTMEEYRQYQDALFIGMTADTPKHLVQQYVAYISEMTGHGGGAARPGGGGIFYAR